MPKTKHTHRKSAHQKRNRNRTSQIYSKRVTLSPKTKLVECREGFNHTRYKEQTALILEQLYDKIAADPNFLRTRVSHISSFGMPHCSALNLELSSTDFVEPYILEKVLVAPWQFTIIIDSEDKDSTVLILQLDQCMIKTGVYNDSKAWALPRTDMAITFSPEVSQEIWKVCQEEWHLAVDS